MPKFDQPSTPCREKSCSEDNTEGEEFIICFREWLGLTPDCKRMLDDPTQSLAHYNRSMGNEAITIFQQAVNTDRGLEIEVWVHITVAIYAMF